MLGELADVGGDGGVGQAQDFRRAPVVGFDAVDFGVRVAVGEFQNVLEMRAAPGIDALAVVADRHDVVVGGGQEVHQRALQFVGVLVFVHEDELETALLFFAHFGMFLEELEPERQQIVKVHRIGRDFAGGVTALQGGDLVGQRGEPGELFGQQVPRPAPAC